MTGIAPDPYWDGKTGGGVRCSSTGDDANKYHDPVAHTMEGTGNRSVASLLPGGSSGIRGVIIPRATVYGGSRGFDPHKPRLVNIDPDIKGQACVVDLSQITKEKMEQAFTAASENPFVQGDIRLLASQTFHNLAIGYEPVGIQSSGGPIPLDRRSPLGDTSYIVPRANLGGGQKREELVEKPLSTQEVISPSITPRTVYPMPSLRKQAAVKPIEQIEEFEPMSPSPNVAGWQPMTEEFMDAADIEAMPTPTPRYVDQTSNHTPVQRQRLKPNPALIKRPLSEPSGLSVRAPSTKVIFEVDGWGMFESVYHEVIRNDCLLVLVYDLRFKAGLKYFPPATDKLLAAKVDDSVFFVHSFGNTFKHGDFEYCLLIIDQDAKIEDSNE